MFQALNKATSGSLRRGFASAPGAQKNTIGAPVIIAGIAVAGALGYYFFNNSGEAVPHSIPEAKAAVKDAFAGKDRPVALNKAEFVPFTLTEVSDYNHNTKKYTFAFPDPNSVSGGGITHLLMVKAKEDGVVVDDKGKEVARPYTPISSPDTVGKMELLIKKYEGGKLTPYLANLKVGDQALFKGPFPKFPYKPSALENGIAIAGGSGITPMYQLIAHSLNLKDDSTKWTLIYSNVTEADILLRKEWDALAKSHPDRLKVVYALDKPPANWKGETGYISSELVKKHAAAADKGEKVKVFVCGPPGQVAAISGPKEGMKQGPVGGALAALGYEASQVFKF